MLCVSRSERPLATRPGPDVLDDAGTMRWSRAMGDAACHLACRYLRDETLTKIVVDPFCGFGSMLDSANEYGFSAIGVDLSPKRCAIARGERKK